MGCDSVNNVFYTYNGDERDISGFGLNPPAYGVKVLCNSLDGFMTQTVSFSSFPSVPGDYYNILNNIFKDGTKPSYNGATTKYMFSGNPLTGEGYTEENAGNISRDNKGIGTFPKTSLMAGETISYTLAHGYARKDNPANYRENIGELISQLNQAEDFILSLKGTIPTYFPNSYACNLVGIEENTASNEVLSLYPNPTENTFTLRSSQKMKNIAVYSTTGQLILSKAISSQKSSTINLSGSLPNGIYFVETTFENASKARQKVNLMR